MKVIFLNTQMEAAGAQKALLTLAAGLRSRGHTVRVVTMYDKGDYVSLFSKQYGLDIVDLKMKPAGKATFLQKGDAAIGGIVKLLRLLRQEKYDVLQTFSHYSNITGPFFGWLAGIPVRVSSQRMSLRGASKWLLVLDRLVANSFLVQRMTAVSEGTRQYSIQEQQINPQKLVTIYNGVDTDKYSIKLNSEKSTQLRHSLKLTEESLVVTMVGRLHPQKGHKYLLAAASKIKIAVPNVHFLLIGEGKLRQELEEEIQRNNLTSFVHLLGMRQDIPELLAISHLFVLPSLWEGLPNVVLEAMTAGLPVVATNVDGTPELIQNNQTGILVPPADSEALGTAVIKLLQDQTWAAKLAQNGKQRALNNFSISKNISDYETLYTNLQHSKN